MDVSTGTSNLLSMREHILKHLIKIKNKVSYGQGMSVGHDRYPWDNPSWANQKSEK